MSGSKRIAQSELESKKRGKGSHGTADYNDQMAKRLAANEKLGKAQPKGMLSEQTKAHQAKVKKAASKHSDNSRKVVKDQKKATKDFVKKHNKKVSTTRTDDGDSRSSASYKDLQLRKMVGKARKHLKK